jgi:hypothetical protein
MLNNAQCSRVARGSDISLIGSFDGAQDAFNISSTPKIASVGGEDITPEHQREFNRFEADGASPGELSTTEAKALGLDREALERC